MTEITELLTVNDIVSKL